RLSHQAIDAGERVAIPGHKLEVLVLRRKEHPTLHGGPPRHVAKEAQERAAGHGPSPSEALRHVAREPARSRQVVDHADGAAPPAEAARNSKRLEVASKDEDAGRACRHGPA